MTKINKVKKLMELTLEHTKKDLTVKERDFLNRSRYMLSLYDNEKDIKDLSKKELEKIELNIMSILK